MQARFAMTAWGEQFIQPEICAEASQISFIADRNLKFWPRSSAQNASEWSKIWIKETMVSKIQSHQRRRQ